MFYWCYVVPSVSFHVSLSPYPSIYHVYPVSAASAASQAPVKLIPSCSLHLFTTRAPFHLSVSRHRSSMGILNIYWDTVLFLL